MTVDLKNVRTEDLIVVSRSWGIMQQMALDDVKASGMLGFIQPYLPKFLTWLLNQEEFKNISKMELEAFVRCMINVVDLKPPACRVLVGTLEQDLKDKALEEDNEV